MSVPFILLPFMAIALTAFIRSDFKENLTNKLILKTLTSLFFIGIGLLSFFFGHANRLYFQFILVAGFFSLCGDVLLVFQEKNKLFFIGGLGSFLLAHVSFIIGYSSFARIAVWDFVLMAVLVSVCLLIYKILKLDLGDMKVAALGYLCVISFMVSKAFSLLYTGGVDQRAGILAAIGALLFITSDAFLVFYDFSKTKKKSARTINLITYYAGQAMIALSIFFST